MKCKMSQAEGLLKAGKINKAIVNSNIATVQGNSAEVKPHAKTYLTSSLVVWRGRKHINYIHKWQLIGKCCNYQYKNEKRTQRGLERPNPQKKTSKKATDQSIKRLQHSRNIKSQRGAWKHFKRSQNDAGLETSYKQFKIMLKKVCVLGAGGGYAVSQEKKKQSHHLREVTEKNKCSLDLYNSQSEIIKEEY